MSNTSRDPLPTLDFDVQDFILGHQIRRVSPRTIEWHERCLAKWLRFCETANITATTGTTAKHLRLFLAQLEKDGHNTGGISAIYRSVRSFLLWYEAEYEPDKWRSPTRKVRIGPGDDEPLDPIKLANFSAFVKTCIRQTFTGDRDRAILYTLLDTGLRRSLTCGQQKNRCCPCRAMTSLPASAIRSSRMPTAESSLKRVTIRCRSACATVCWCCRPIPSRCGFSPTSRSLPRTRAALAENKISLISFTICL